MNTLFLLRTSFHGETKQMGVVIFFNQQIVKVKEPNNREIKSNKLRIIRKILNNIVR